MSLRSLDVFSGMAGITYALRGLGIVPVAYCEKALGPQRLLRNLMKRGSVPVAPVEPDIASIPGDKYKGKVDIIVGGFPCTGFSVCGKRDGFENNESKLFNELVRLSKAIRPKFIFLENVKQVASSNDTISQVVKAIAPLGYELRWLIVSADSVGCPQQRARWFCLCVRNDVAKKGFELTQTPVRPFGWKSEPETRMQPTLTQIERDFIAACGNGVCSDAVRTAFIMCFEGLRDDGDPRRLFAKRKIALQPVVPIPHSGDSYAKACIFKSGSIQDSQTQPSWPLKKNSGRNLTVSTTFFRPAPGKKLKNTLPAIEKLESRTMWYTPRASNASTASNVLTTRNVRDIGTQLRFEQGTKNSQRSGRTAPVWLGWLMGYPTSWVKNATRP